MTQAARAKLFANVFAVADSPVEAEAVAAFLKYRMLREKLGWPTFTDLLRKLESGAMAEPFEAVEHDLPFSEKT